MLEYHVYIIGPEGPILRRIDLFCPDDEAAIGQACKFVDGHDVEVWQDTRKVTLIPCQRQE